MTIAWAFYRHQEADEARRAAGRAETGLVQVQDRLRLLEDKVESLALLCQAQWELIRDRTSLAEEHIEAKVAEIDARDGKADGKMGRVESSCPHCHRPLHRRHRHCLYCGGAVAEGHRFQV